MSLNHECTSTSEDCRRLQPGAEDQYRSAHRAAVADSRPSPAGGSLVSCVYIALRCSRCGDFRQALAELPRSGSVACPECGRDCSFVLLASGLTTRNLPFHERQRVEPARWDRWMSDPHNSS